MEDGSEEKTSNKEVESGWREVKIKARNPSLLVISPGLYRTLMQGFRERLTVPQHFQQ